jgi:signal transduction histidine kinase
LVDDLLDYARIEGGTFRLMVEEADLLAKVKEVAESLSPQLQSASLELELNLPEGAVALEMDPQRIEQVLHNLLSNAIKFSKPKSRICLRVRPEKEQVVVEVQDTGEGISEEDIPKLFQMFSQLEGGAQIRQGTGLGLGISKAIVEAHHGKIGVTSEVGKGSTFWFTLPFVQIESPLEV